MLHYFDRKLIHENFVHLTVFVYKASAANAYINFKLQIKKKQTQKLIFLKMLNFILKKTTQSTFKMKMILQFK